LKFPVHWEEISQLAINEGSIECPSPTNNQSVLGQILKEAFCLTAVHVEVEGIGGHSKTEDSTYGQGG
jgi:hypothetical protein